jgi:hypothetical protein
VKTIRTNQAGRAVIATLLGLAALPARAADETPVSISSDVLTNVVVGQAPPKPAPDAPAPLFAHPQQVQVRAFDAVGDTDAAPYNQLVLDAVADMPKGGGYSTGREATERLRDAVSLDGTGAEASLVVEPEGARPSFCSEATYLVLMEVYARLQSENRLTLDHDELDRLLVRAQADGEGVWGRWNANGPGTARLFYELRMGENFSDLDRARPGDFMKIFWNDEIGGKEKGHSVIFLGRKDGASVRIWSSNLDGGYGEKDVPLANIHRVIFSRLLVPARVRNALLLPEKDEYLAGLLKGASTPEEVAAKTGMAAPPRAPSESPAKAASADFQPVPGTHRAMPVDLSPPAAQ